MVTKKATTTKPKVKVTKEKVKEAEGKKNISAAWNERVAGVTAETIPAFQNNILYQQALQSVLIQVFPAPPEVWVNDPDGIQDDDLTAELKAEFERLNGYEQMQHVIGDVYGYGASVFSVGRELKDGHYSITELRHLDAKSFHTQPPTYNPAVMTMPNDLMPGIILNENDEVEVWQTLSTGSKVKLNNTTIVRNLGSPEPSGLAYMKPVYIIMALMDFAHKAYMQQISRIGAPIILPKVADDVTETDMQYLMAWGSQFVKSWSHNTAALVPQGIEFPALNFHESTSAKEAIEMWRQWILDYVNPMSMMQQTGNLGASDTGRMEMWANSIISRQDMCEHWLEEEFNWWLEANGYEGYKACIELKRPSVDKDAMKLQYLTAAVQSGLVTDEEARDNMTSILELHETTEELLEELKAKKQASALSLFTNVNDGFKGKEEKQVKSMQETLREINDATAIKIAEILNYGS